VIRARASRDVVDKHSNCGGLTRRRGARYRRQRSKPTRLRVSRIAPRALPNMRGQAPGASSAHINRMAPRNRTHVKRKREPKPREPYPKPPSYSPEGKVCKTPRGHGMPGHEECDKPIAKGAPRVLVPVTAGTFARIISTSSRAISGGIMHEDLIG
jgi:hypothetical protein